MAWSCGDGGTDAKVPVPRTLLEWVYRNAPTATPWLVLTTNRLAGRHPCLQTALLSCRVSNRSYRLDTLIGPNTPSLLRLYRFHFRVLTVTTNETRGLRDMPLVGVMCWIIRGRRVYTKA